MLEKPFVDNTFGDFTKCGKNTNGSVRGGVKKNTGFFLLFVKRGAGGSRPIQKILIRKYSDFFDQFLTNFDQFLTNFGQF